jgi:hypothetical protein
VKFDVIEQEPGRLREVTGIGPKRAERIVGGWAEQKVIREIMLFLHSNGVARRARCASTRPTARRPSSSSRRTHIGSPCPRRRRSQAGGPRNRWFADSSLEEAVTSEPVSEPQIPCYAGKIQGISSI